MADQVAQRDANRVPVLLGTGNDSDAEVKYLLVDPTTGYLLVDGFARPGGHDSVGEDTSTVSTAGTAVQLANHSCQKVFITAHEANGALTNGGLVVIGSSSVVAASNGRKGVGLYAGQTIALEVTNTNLLYVDSVDDGAKIHYLYLA